MKLRHYRAMYKVAPFLLMAIMNILLSVNGNSVVVVDCGQTLVSYTPTTFRLTEPTVVDCGQTLVSYTRQEGAH